MGSIFDLLKRKPQDHEPIEDGGKRRVMKYHTPFQRNVDPATGKLRPGKRFFDPTLDTRRDGDEERHMEFYNEERARRAAQNRMTQETIDAANAKRERRKAKRKTKET